MADKKNNTGVDNSGSRNSGSRNLCLNGPPWRDGQGLLGLPINHCRPVAALDGVFQLLPPLLWRQRGLSLRFGLQFFLFFLDC